MKSIKSEIRSIYAHSDNSHNQKQSLISHLLKVAESAQSSVINSELGKLAYYAGILHDLGKISPEFQRKLELQTSNRVDHKGLGFGFGKRFKSQILQTVIAGHHGGLCDAVNIDAWWKNIHQQGKLNALFDAGQKVLKSAELAEKDWQEPEEKLPFSYDIATRMVFSALVDADFLDTERHFQPQLAVVRRPAGIDARFIDQYNRYYKDLCKGKAGELNLLRGEINRNCVNKAALPPGFFRLTVPTGGGKTLASLGFALNHAVRHKLDRIIYAIPYTSIIEQISGEFSDIFTDGSVLEHHTGIKAHESSEYSRNDTWSRLAAENWDAPLIVTTTVQLFESLLGRSTSVCRKVHNIQNSVIILDEVQTLPMQLLPVIMDLLTELIEHFRVTVVFCTATQPALTEYLRDQKIKPVELAPDPVRLFKTLKRVRYSNESRTECTWEQVAKKLLANERVMAVVNTKKDARHLWETLGDEECYHLSSFMCGQHRRIVLDEVRAKLKSREPCRLVATQVVEAGVDVDFDCVLRAVGPLDRIVQAAGRCNRESRLAKGEVIVFKPAEGSYPRGIYGSALHKSGQLLNDAVINLDLNNPETFPDYFKRLRLDITEDPDNICRKREQLKFEQVARDFKMIDDDGLTVIVEYEPDLKKINRLIEQLRTVPAKARHLIRELQPYMVNLAAWDFQKYNSMISEVFPGVYKWNGRYDERLGLLKEIDLTKYCQ